MTIKAFLFCLPVISITGCSAIKETSRFQMESGMYRVKNKENKRFYTIVDEDKITLHPVARTKQGWSADSAITSAVYLNSLNEGVTTQPVTFVLPSFDLDVLTILFKYRPYTSGFPNQLNTNFNAAGYIGYRSDIYVLSYDRTPVNTYVKRINHFGYSLGFFGGLGSTTMNPFVTNNQSTTEYDGIVFTKGITGLIALGTFTFGACLGADHLLDKNHKAWIYQKKPWIGFSIGLNLN